MGNYRIQNATSVGSQVACPTCSTSLTLCFATTANELCCGQPSAAIVFIPSNQTFATATNLYTSAAMTTISPAGYYSDDQPTACGVSCTEYTHGGSNTGTATYIDCAGNTATSSYDGPGGSGTDYETFCASSITSYTGNVPSITGVC